MSERPKPRVTVIGLGRMGIPIASAFLDAGYPTTVWNRTAAKADALIAQGASRAATATEAVAASQLVIVPLLDHHTVREALASAAPALRGRTLVNLANSTPDHARELAAWAEEHGADYLDGAMMALPETVATPEGFFLYSGSQPAFTAYRRELEVMAPAHYFGTDPGAAEVHDLALLGAGYAALTGFLHAAALLDSMGTTPEVFAPLAARWLHGMAEFLPELAREAGSATYRDGVSTVDLNRAAVDSLIQLSRASGIATDVHEPLKALLDSRSSDGHGQDSFSSVFELLRSSPGSHEG
ncbi:NAD(P)-dependent oxidoreductase [Streptomyces albipurpureus]|uniref:NAD(P)-binding domain-containing protein n=1 Tax=Streptomyces albipurpureus TaxID=2897419 RepID=A0ABT0UT54_9ACTN|nr:NAD(P)-binding domain-containing protein [Streptomyces sp. CWNU-1]MCM2390775.1 NAD(P)-binding domain-containing protein [Streptomyces sp. CWNU-1]